MPDATGTTTPEQMRLTADTPRPELVTVPDVELLEVGSFRTMAGNGTFTAEDLAAIVEAAEDPAIRTPIVKIGHLDPRFGNDPQTTLDPEAPLDGQPALGRITNLRLSDDGMTLIGDLAGVPAWLADAMGSAYPSRSVELLRNWESSTGRTHQAVLTGLALLGENLPAVQTLEDVRGLFAQQSHTTTYGEARSVVVMGAQPLSEQVAASVNLEDVRRAWYEKSPRSSIAWIREMWSDFLIVDDDEGQLWRVPWSEDDGDVTFGDPTPVKVSYVDDDSQTVAAADGRQPVLLARASGDVEHDVVMAVAHRSHSTPTTTGNWDGPAVESSLPDDSPQVYRYVYAWRDGDGDESNKASYKFPHHHGDGGAANTNACQAIVASLNGARGGADIPDSDRSRVYAHAARHLRDADITPTELAASPDTPDTATDPRKEETHMDATRLRERLGLEADASDEEVEARLAELLGEDEPTADEPEADTDDVDEDGDIPTILEASGPEDEEPAEADAEPDEEVDTPPGERTSTPPGERTAGDDDGSETSPHRSSERVAASLQVPEGMRLVDEATFAELKTKAEQGAEARRQQREEYREQVLAAAVQEGKFPPAQMDAYRQRWIRDPEATEELITKHLAAGLVPVQEEGHAKDDSDRAEAELAEMLLFPDADQRRRTAAEGR